MDEMDFSNAFFLSSQLSLVIASALIVITKIDLQLLYFFFSQVKISDFKMDPVIFDHLASREFDKLQLGLLRMKIDDIGTSLSIAVQSIISTLSKAEANLFTFQFCRPKEAAYLTTFGIGRFDIIQTYHQASNEINNIVTTRLAHLQRRTEKVALLISQLEDLGRFCRIRARMVPCLQRFPEHLLNEPQLLIKVMHNAGLCIDESYSSSVASSESGLIDDELFAGMESIGLLSECLEMEVAMLLHLAKASIGIQNHYFQESTLNAFLGGQALSRWKSIVKYTNAKGKANNMLCVLRRLYHWLSVKIGLFFYHVIQPKQILMHVADKKRRVHFSDEVEPEYLIPILEYHRKTHPLNISLLYLLPENTCFLNGFVCQSDPIRLEKPCGLKRFPAILSYPNDPPYEHWPNIITIIQSHNRFYKQKSYDSLKSQAAAKQSQNYGVVFSLLSGIRSTPAIQLRDTSIPDDPYLKEGYTINFYDKKMNVTYVVSRLDPRVFVVVVHSGEQNEKDIGVALLTARLSAIVDCRPIFE